MNSTSVEVDVEENDDMRPEDDRVNSKLRHPGEMKHLFRLLVFFVVASLILNACLSATIVHLRRRTPSLHQRIPLPPTVCFSYPDFQTSESRGSSPLRRLKCLQSDPDIHRVVSRVVHQDMEDDNNADSGKDSELSTFEDWKQAPTTGQYLALSIRVLSLRCHGSGNFLNSIYRESVSSNPMLCSKFTLPDSREIGRHGDGDITTGDPARRLSIVAGIVSLIGGERLRSTDNGEGGRCTTVQSSYFALIKV